MLSNGRRAQNQRGEFICLLVNLSAAATRWDDLHCRVSVWCWLSAGAGGEVNFTWWAWSHRGETEEREPESLVSAEFSDWPESQIYTDRHIICVLLLAILWWIHSRIILLLGRLNTLASDTYTHPAIKLTLLLVNTPLNNHHRWQKFRFRLKCSQMSSFLQPSSTLSPRSQSHRRE